MEKPTLDEILGEFDAGIFTDKATEALRIVALGVVQSGKKGSVSINIDLQQIGQSDSVTVKHTLKFSKPTKNGKQNEENTTATPMFVSNEGYLSVSSRTQRELFSDAENVTKFKGSKNG